MRKIKILWMSNKVQSGTKDHSTGGWLTAMAEGLINTGEVELANISRGKVEKVTRQDFGEICQWVVPITTKLNSNSLLPSKEIIKNIEEITDCYAPDLIHIWGTEDIWGLLTARKYIQRPAILEMQGLKGAIARVFHGGLGISEQLACIGLKEIIKRSSIFRERKSYQTWELIDKEIIAGHDFITVQTEWMEAQVKAINNHCKIFRNDLLLRNIFYNVLPWQYSGQPILFCSAAYPSPFKGLHVAIRATAILKQYYPNVQLRIAGALQRQGIRQEGYIAWLNREVKRLNLDSNVKWLGGISAAQITDEIKSAAVAILPSFIENCSNFMQEGMIMGVPMVVSFVGGLPSLARDEESALFFASGDEVMCAHQIKRLLTDRLLAEQISRRAREIALERNDCNQVVQNQIETYRQVINECGKGT
jgi:glycosyltransferase involved in cell wall biosynthesis